MVVEQIKNHFRITDLLNRCGISMNRAGFISSPYRKEKTPSCKIYIKTDSFYDFAESKGGDVIDLYMLLCHVDKKTAIKQMGEMIGAQSYLAPAVRVDYRKQIDLKLDDILTTEELELYYERLGLTDSEDISLRFIKQHRISKNSEVLEAFFSYCISEAGDPKANHYLHTKRLIQPETAKRFRLFTIRDYSAANSFLKNKFRLEQLQKCGICNDKGNLIFWRYKIMIPYIHRGKIVYLRGRFFDDTEKVPENTGKYIGLRDDGLGVNTPKRFFNWDVVSRMNPGEKIYIVEGEFDCMMVEQLGYNCIGVAGTGTVNLDRLEQLLPFEVVLMVDADEAGLKLRGRLLKKFSELSKEVSIKELPFSKDVTDFVVRYAG